MADLFSLLEINSERDDSKADAQHPFGPGPVKALEKFLEIADRDGYPTKNVDNYAGHFEFGDGEEVLGIFAHMDVVPAGSGWNTDPYTPTIKDGRLYARGASDDKGPTTACYYGLKIIKELGLPTSKKSSLHRRNRRRIGLGRHGLLLRARRTCEARLWFLS